MGWGSFEAAVRGSSDLGFIVGIWSTRMVFAGKGKARGARVIPIGEYASRLERRWPFLEPTIRKNRDKWAKEITDRIAAATYKNKASKKGGDPFKPRKPNKAVINRILHGIGKRAVEDVKATVKGIHQPPLADRTVKRKARRRKRRGVRSVPGFGPEKPLIEEGYLLEAIEYRLG
jgi:hypothetical protein